MILFCLNANCHSALIVKPEMPGRMTRCVQISAAANDKEKSEIKCFTQSMLNFLIMQACQITNGTAMTCLLPRLNLPPDFINSNDTRRVGLSAASVTNTFGNATAEIYVGFQLDGYTKYVNTSKTLPYINFTLIPLSISVNCDKTQSITEVVGNEKVVTITVCLFFSLSFSPALLISLISALKPRLLHSWSCKLLCHVIMCYYALSAAHWCARFELLGDVIGKRVNLRALSSISNQKTFEIFWKKAI